MNSQTASSLQPIHLTIVIACAPFIAWAPATRVPAQDAPLAEQSTSVVASGAKLQLLANSFSFTEGPTTDNAGNVYFTDQPNDAIHVWNIDGTLSTFLQPSGRSNGLFFGKDGTLWACADEKNQLWAIAADKTHQVMIAEFSGKLLNGPNDLWIHSNGDIYFTDPFYKRPYWKRGAIEQPAQSVYRLAADTHEVTLVADGLEQPNGIIGDAERKLLFVADIRAGKTYQYSIAADGSLTNREKFCDMGSDGMTIDKEGRIYLTGGKGVTVFDKSGKQIEVIAVPKNWTANCTFGGPNRDILFITASDSLYSIATTTSGY